MPTSPMPPAGLTALIRDALAAGGFSDANAGIVSQHLVDAEMKGVSSHGVNRLGLYLGEAKRDVIDPKADPVITEPRGGMLHVDGARGIGIVAMKRATDAGIAAAEARGMATVGIVKCGHTGRMGAYGEQAAEAGFMAISLGGGGRRLWGNVVPFGGKDPMMSTNPYTLALPGGPGDPVVCDFAISTWPAGKVAVARANGQTLPPDVVVDKNGQPSRDPEAFYDGGALLPAAGAKGSGMGIIAELMGDAMLGEAVEYNWLIVLIRADAFRPMADYAKAAEGFMAEVRGSTPAPGFEKVIMPGERETSQARAAAEAGIVVGDGVWNGIVEAARSVGIEPGDYV
jgi:LDH2 family malate/lactate/ureidoglycolate dehydrogenase